MEKRGRRSKIVVLLVLIPFFVLTVFQFLTPLVIQKNNIKDLSGNTVISENSVSIDKLGFPWTTFYQCGDILCHQRADRSFFINGNQMPFCARCTAILIGITLGLAFMIFFKIELDRRFLIFIFIGIIPIGIDGIGQLFGAWESNNLIRVVTGGLIGVISGIALAVIIDELLLIKNKKSIF